MPGAAVQLEGLAKVNRAFRYVDGLSPRTVQDALKEAAEPTRARAEVMAVSNIRNIGETWSRMRTGATTNSVYIAPRARRRRGSPRPNLGRALFEQMNQALEQTQDKVVREVERAIDKLGNQAGF